MEPRAFRGTALLVAAPSARAAAEAPRALGNLAEVLLRSGWKVLRLDARGTGATACTPDNLVRALGAFGQTAADFGLIVIAGNIVDGDGAPALVTDARWTELASMSLSESTLPLTMLRAGTSVPRLAIVVAGWGRSQDWLDAIRTGRRADSFVIAPNTRAMPALVALREALAGAAVDPATGTITARSLCAYLATPGITVLPADDDGEIGVRTALSGLWDPRLSRSRPAAEPGRDDLTGSVLPGQFRLDAVIARGGFGTVYRAHQITVGRDVAVKLLHSDVDPSSPSGRLFVQEIQSVGRIDHPNVVRILHADVTSGGRLFFAMELLDGRDLEQLVENALLPPRRAVDIALQLLDGLGAAHAVDLVHADIKPANVLLVPSRDGERVVLVDFGLARLRSAADPIASVGGTPAYMAPEQLRSGRVDARSDIFAVALLTVRLLTGWRRQNKDELVPPLDDIADPKLRETLARALDLDPAARFQSAGELAAALADTPFAPRNTPVLEVGGDRPYGRDAVLDELLDAVLVRRIVALTGPEGIGKTTLVRGGLMPRLAALGMRTIYARCARGAAREVAEAIDGDTSNLAVVLDDLDSAPATLDAVLARGVSTVIACAREAPARADVAIVRLGPLPDPAAHEAIALWFEERRIAIEPSLVDTVVRDLRGPDGCAPATLRRACGLLYDALSPTEARVQPEHYARIARELAPRRRSRRGVLPVVAAGVAVAAVAGAWLAWPHHGQGMHLVAVEGVDQSIPLNEWSVFGVQVLDGDGVPVPGIRVAWQTPSMGTLSYVEKTDAHGMAHSTQMYSSETEGNAIEVAGLAPPLYTENWYPDGVPLIGAIEIPYHLVRPHAAHLSASDRRAFEDANPFIPAEGMSVSSHELTNRELSRLAKISASTLPDAPAPNVTQPAAAEFCAAVDARLMTEDEWVRLAGGKPAIELGGGVDVLAEWTSTLDHGRGVARGRTKGAEDTQRIDALTGSPTIGFRCVR